MKTLLTIPLLAICLLFSCSSDEEPAAEEPIVEEPIEPDPDPVDEDDPDDYFPMKENKQWQYTLSYFDADSAFISAENLVLTIEGDTIVEDVVYRRFVDANGILRKIARRKDNQYFGRNHEMYGGFSHEYIFLDANIAAGESWSYLKNDGVNKTEYIVEALHDEYTIGGVAFNNVLEIQTNYYDLVEHEFVLKYSVKHFYAKGLGEIYSYYPNTGFDWFEHMNVQITGYQSN